MFGDEGLDFFATLANETHAEHIACHTPTCLYMSSELN